MVQEWPAMNLAAPVRAPSRFYRSTEPMESTAESSFDDEGYSIPPMFKSEIIDDQPTTEATSHDDDQLEEIELELDGIVDMVKKMIIPDLRNQGKQIDALKERLKLSELESTGLRAQIRSQDAVIQSQGKVIQGLKLKDDVATAASRMPWARIDEEPPAEPVHDPCCEEHTQMLAKAGQALYQHQQSIQNLERKIEDDFERRKWTESATLHRVEQFDERISALEQMRADEDPAPGVKRTRSRDGDPDFDTVTYLENCISENSKKINQVAVQVNKLNGKVTDLSVSGGAKEPSAPKTSNAAILSLHNRIVALEENAPSTGPHNYMRHQYGARDRGTGRGRGRNFRPYGDVQGRTEGDEDIIGLRTPAPPVEQPVPPSFQVDQAEMTAQEIKRHRIFAQYMNEVQRMYTVDSLKNMKEKIEIGISRCPPFTGLHELEYEQLQKLVDKVDAALLKMDPAAMKKDVVEELVTW